MIRLASISSLALAAALGPAWAEVPEATIESLSAPDQIETRVGTLDFQNGVPSAETAAPGLRHARLHQCAQRLQQQLPRRLGLCAAQGLRGGRRRRTAW